MATARVFKSGNSQAVRLPKAFRLKGPEVEITRRGDEIVLREKPPKKKGLAEVLDILAAMPDDMFEDIKDTRPPEEREGL
jgi:antitoxin VapB